MLRLSGASPLRKHGGSLDEGLPGDEGPEQPARGKGLFLWEARRPNRLAQLVQLEHGPLLVHLSRSLLWEKCDGPWLCAQVLE